MRGWGQAFRLAYAAEGGTQPCPLWNTLAHATDVQSSVPQCLPVNPN